MESQLGDGSGKVGSADGQRAQRGVKQGDTSDTVDALKRDDDLDATRLDHWLSMHRRFDWNTSHSLQTCDVWMLQVPCTHTGWGLRQLVDGWHIAEWSSRRVTVRLRKKFYVRGGERDSYYPEIAAAR